MLSLNHLSLRQFLVPEWHWDAETIVIEGASGWEKTWLLRCVACSMTQQLAQQILVDYKYWNLILASRLNEKQTFKTGRKMQKDEEVRNWAACVKEVKLSVICNIVSSASASRFKLLSKLSLVIVGWFCQDAEGCMHLRIKVSPS